MKIGDKIDICSCLLQPSAFKSNYHITEIKKGVCMYCGYFPYSTVAKQGDVMRWENYKNRLEKARKEWNNRQQNDEEKNKIRKLLGVE